MRRTLNASRRGIAVLAAFLLVGWGPAPSQAEDIPTSSLSANRVSSLIGDWALTVDLPGEESMHLALSIKNIGGKVGATIQSSLQTQPQVITDITESSLALKLRYHALFGESESAMVLIVRALDSGTLTGSMADELNLLGAEATDSEESLGLGLFAARVHGVKGGKIPGRALASFGGKEVKITYGSLRTNRSDYETLQNLEDGEVFEFSMARATKLFTDADLKFGDVVIKTENAGKNYPGVYSLWLKKSGGGWSLVFNEHADVWGTMYEPEVNVAVVPLKVRKLDEEQTRFTIEVEDTIEGGLIRLAWGDTEWSTQFSIGQ